MDRFEQLHKKWLYMHLSKRHGERKRRLQEGHSHLEIETLRRVWVPAFGNLKYLHPEYEVKDFFEGRRYLDFAYIRPPVKIAIEADGYGAHYRDISRREFCNDRIRQIHLLNDGWMVVRIGHDDIKERPKMWQQLLQQMFGRLFGASDGETSELYSREREVVRMAMRLQVPIKLSHVSHQLQCGYRAARNVMKYLEDSRIMLPALGGEIRTHAWKLNENHPFLFSLIWQ